LLQQQTQNPQYRQVMGMQAGSTGQMGVRPSQGVPNQQFEESNYDFI